MNHDRILLAHGSGGKLAHQLIQEVFLPELDNPFLSPLQDGALLDVGGNRLVFTTDSYVVDPIFFPGGDIGKLAVSGTVNDLAVMGAIPRYLTLSFLLEEGLPLGDLKKILKSIRESAKTAGIQIVSGDTKVVARGSLDKIFINTSGIGVIPEDFRMSYRIHEGDRIIITGTMGDHGTTVMALREGLKMQSELKSDCAPLNNLIEALHDFSGEIHLMRDPTRGGVATTLNEIVENSGFGILLKESELPVKEEVKGLCEILGLDPLYIANEGKVMLVVSKSAAHDILKTIRKNPLGQDAQIIGEVIGQHGGKVVLETEFGSRRIIDMLTGEQLPRIC